MLRIVQKKYADYIVKPFLIRYLRSPRIFRYGSLRLRIYPGVFHPGFFFSTKFMARFVERLNINGKTLCEVGAGSGLISFIALQNGAKVTAFDLNKTAVDGINENFKSIVSGKMDLAVYHSDMFGNIPAQEFDFVIINPPYFFKKISGDATLAWNCGENGEYFNKLFAQLSAYVHDGSGIYMVLADNCDVEAIRDRAGVNNFVMTMVEERKIKWEKNFIFKL